jgi:hypothetical protein
MSDEIEGPFYTRSTGQRVPLSAMATPHLKSAFAKLQREWPDHPELAGMGAEIERRDAEFAAAEAAKEQAS